MGMEYPLNQSAWRRGWNDTKAIWTSWQFYVLSAVVAVGAGGVFEWYWGLGVVLIGMLCAWIGATASAPIRQRNEARHALEKLSQHNQGNMKVSESVSHLFISDPNKSALDAIYSTHPPIEERIKRLRAM